MSGTPDFAHGAERLAGLAGALLGWRPGEFWAATPAELATALDPWRGESVVPPDADTLSRLKDQWPDG